MHFLEKCFIQKLHRCHGQVILNFSNESLYFLFHIIVADVRRFQNTSYKSFFHKNFPNYKIQNLQYCRH